MILTASGFNPQLLDLQEDSGKEGTDRFRSEAGKMLPKWCGLKANAHIHSSRW